MIGDQDRWQEDIFIAGPLRQFIPQDHILMQVDKILDLSWLRDEVRDCYDERRGRPSIDPESALRLMLAGYFQGLVHDRKLMREAQVNLAIRWFAGYRFHEKLPDHSSLTRIRQRWGPDRFRRIFSKTVDMCVEAGLVSCETVHMDATLIRADVSWGSLTRRHVDDVLEANHGQEDSQESGDSGGGGSSRGRRVKGRKKEKRVSRTDPDATMATSRKDQRLEPTYKQHTSVDDDSGVVVDVELTTGEVSEGGMLLCALDRVEGLTGKKVQRVTGDGSYCRGSNYAGCERRATEAVIPVQPEARKVRRMPLRRFKYDAHKDVVVCPCGSRLHRSYRSKQDWFYRARLQDCAGCANRSRCVAPSMKYRVVKIVNGYPALLRARRIWQTDGDRLRSWYARHRWRVEGVQGTGKTQHGLRRAVRRGLSNVAIQVYLTAAVINLKSLARLFLSLLGGVQNQCGTPGGPPVESDEFFRLGIVIRPRLQAIT